MSRLTDWQMPAAAPPAGGIVAIPGHRRLIAVCAGALLVAVAALGGTDARADKRTVCTITVNSPDERETFRQRLPADDYQFVELVERGRPDWLASACRQGVRCDVLVISGHFDSGTEFYSDRLGMRESLPVAEMERASCSDSCPGVFADLKEVYLFGCNTLNPQVTASTSPEVERSLVRVGHSPAEAKSLARALDERHGESSRERMRRVFANVPVIYGFSALAPLGPTAATMLNRYFEASTATGIGTGRADPALLRHFAASGMTVAGGLTETDAQAGYRRDVCRFVDDRLSPAAKLAFVHDLLSSDVADARMFLDRIEALYASLGPGDRQDQAFVRAQGEIARDAAARDRYLRFAEDADLPRVRARMIRLAGTLGWLSPAEERAEIVRMVGDLIARKSIGSSDVELICSLNEGRELDPESGRLSPTAQQADRAGNAAALACLGSGDARARVLRALTSHDDEDVEIAQVYLGHRPITDVDELRIVASGITRMTGAGGQVRALDTLARHRLSDRQSLSELTRLFPATHSVDVQRAIAAVFIRADDRALAKPEVARVLAQYRLKSPDGSDIIDILIRRLRTP
jgi:hypothetical protein